MVDSGKAPGMALTGERKQRLARIGRVAVLAGRACCCGCWYCCWAGCCAGIFCCGADDCGANTAPSFASSNSIDSESPLFP